MSREASKPVGSAESVRNYTACPRERIAWSRAPILVGAAATALALAGLAAVAPSAQAEGPKPAPEVVVYASDLPESALYEVNFLNDSASPGGRMAGTPNHGADLDPPPENDPHVSFKAKVQSGIPYRVWVHMKVGKPKGVSEANLLFVQFSDAVDKDNKEVLKPGTGDYLSLRGPTKEGWAWVGQDAGNAKAAPRLVTFRTSGEVTVRIQAGMEGVGFDQVVLSPARFLQDPPAEAVVAKVK